MGRQPCCDKMGVKKGPWTREEDQKLVSFLLTHGRCCWRLVPKLAGLLRCGKSCRLRWINYLRPDLKRGLLSDDEERLVIDLHAQLGNRWSKIAAWLPGRTDNEIKNQWNTHIRKKLLRKGIDPVTHLPLKQAPALPVQEQEQEREQTTGPQKLQESQNDSKLLKKATAEEEEGQGLPHKIPEPQANTCGFGPSASAGFASVVSPSYSSSATGGVDLTQWPEPMYLFGMDGIMDAGWGAPFPGDGINLDPFDQYPGGGGFNQGDDWL